MVFGHRAQGQRSFRLLVTVARSKTSPFSGLLTAARLGRHARPSGDAAKPGLAPQGRGFADSAPATQSGERGFLKPDAHVYSGRDFNVVDDTRGLGDGQPILSEPSDVQLDGLAQQALGRIDGRAGGHAAGQIRDVGWIVPHSPLHDDRVSLDCCPPGLSPACFKTLFKVPGGEVVAGLSRHGNAARLCRALELAVAALGGSPIPAISPEQAQHLAQLHAGQVRRSASKCP
jgi:hypothetical protein